MLKRVFDIALCLLVGIIILIPFFLICIAIKITSKGPIFHMSKRIGKDNETFLMPKFRSMDINSPQVATHLLENPKDFLTPIGSFLRKSSLDEVPQLLSVLKGDMSFVGPRPALFNQYDLIELRTNCGVSSLIPGITGWAQINGRDELLLATKVKYDYFYLKNKSILFDIKIIFMTAYKVFKSEGVNH